MKLANIKTGLLINFNLFGSDSPLLAASNFVGWIKRVARIHRVCGGYTPSALYPPYTVNTPQLAAGIFITGLLKNGIKRFVL